MQKFNRSFSSENKTDYAINVGRGVETNLEKDFHCQILRQNLILFKKKGKTLNALNVIFCKQLLLL